MPMLFKSHGDQSERIPDRCVLDHERSNRVCQQRRLEILSDQIPTLGSCTKRPGKLNGTALIAGPDRDYSTFAYPTPDALISR